MNNIDAIRQAGVRRGIMASIRTLEKELAKHGKNSTGAHTLTIALIELHKLTVDAVENDLELA